MSTESKYIMCRPYFSLKCEKIRSMPFKQGGHGVGDNGEGLAKGRLYPTKVLLNHVKNFLGGFYKDDGMADNKEMEASMSMADIGVAVIVGKVVTKVSILAFGSRNFSIRYGVMACIQAFAIYGVCVRQNVTKGFRTDVGVNLAYVYFLQV